jgi:hypothetical protein
LKAGATFQLGLAAVGSVETAPSPFESTTTHIAVATHEIALGSTKRPIGLARQVGFGAVGLVEMMALLLSSTATHSDVVLHDTPKRSGKALVSVPVAIAEPGVTSTAAAKPASSTASRQIRCQYASERFIGVGVTVSMLVLAVAGDLCGCDRPRMRHVSSYITSSTPNRRRSCALSPCSRNSHRLRSFHRSVASCSPRACSSRSPASSSAIWRERVTDSVLPPSAPSYRSSRLSLRILTRAKTSPCCSLSPATRQLRSAVCCCLLGDQVYAHHHHHPVRAVRLRVMAQSASPTVQLAVADRRAVTASS